MFHPLFYFRRCVMSIYDMCVYMYCISTALAIIGFAIIGVDMVRWFKNGK